MDSKAIGTLTCAHHEGTRSRQSGRPVVREALNTIQVNGQQLVALLCTPDKPNFLVLGFVAAEGLIKGLDDVLLLQAYEDQEGVIEVALNGRQSSSSDRSGGEARSSLADDHGRLRT